MATTSYPAVGVGGFTDEQWTVAYGADDGIVEDFHTAGVSACDLQRINAGNIARVRPGKVRVNGYTLDVGTDTDLTVGTAAGTYYVCAKYDPTLNVADGGGDANPAGPCRLIVSAGTPSTVSGEQYVTLWTITRAASQDLTAATVVDCRTWRGPIHLQAGDPGTPFGFGPFPRGTHLYRVRLGRVEHLIRDLVGSVLAWRSSDVEDWIAFPYSAGFVANLAAPAVPGYAKGGWGDVELRGEVKPATGSFTVAVGIGQLPTTYRPLFRRRFMCAGAAGPCEVYVNPGGTVVINPRVAHAWVDLSGVKYRAEQ